MYCMYVCMYVYVCMNMQCYPGMQLRLGRPRHPRLEDGIGLGQQGQVTRRPVVPERRAQPQPHERVVIVAAHIGLGQG